MSAWTEDIIAEFHQKILSGCLKICKIRQGITFFCHTLYTVFHKMGTPLFCVHKFSKSWSIVMKIISLCLLWISVTCHDVFLQKYNNWGMLQEWGYQSKITDVHELAKRNANHWDKVYERTVDTAIGEWQKTSSLCGCRRPVLWQAVTFSKKNCI